MRSLRRQPSLPPIAEHPSTVGCAATTATRILRLQFEPGLAPSRQVSPVPDEFLACGPATPPPTQGVPQLRLALTLAKPGLRTEASACVASSRGSSGLHAQDSAGHPIRLQAVVGYQYTSQLLIVHNCPAQSFNAAFGCVIQRRARLIQQEGG